MTMAAKFYHCNVCGNVMAAVVPSGVVPFCCDSEMEALTPNSMEASNEHHIPEVTLMDHNVIRVKVGKNFHPATTDHHICFIVVETEQGATIRYLDASELPEVTIQCDGYPRVVYAYCNKHGLWKKVLHDACNSKCTV